MRICLVTAEFLGLFKNGGIGTANTGFALELAAAGHEVTVAYVDPLNAFGLPRSHAFLAVRARWQERGVFLDVVPRGERLEAGVDDFCWSLSVLGYLRARRFDVVLFNECGGQGYFSLLAKRAGVFANAPRMIVVTHGASEWASGLNGQLPVYYGEAGLAFFERRSVELADGVVSPSQYLIDWMRERGWRLPERTQVLQNIVPVERAEPAPAAEIDEIVFFGRLETRKGLEIFCDAIDALDREGRLGSVGVTFLGKFLLVGGLHSGVFVIERSKGWSVAPRILVDLDQGEALDYLKRPGVLAVMPSLAENSPCVVVECLLAGVPFVATQGGGTSELVAESDRAACLVPPQAHALARKLADALAHGQPRARLAEPQERTRARWREWVETLETAPAPKAPPACVSVCVSLPDGAEIEPLALEAIRAQTHPDVELILVVYGAAEDRDEDTNPRRLTRRSPDRAAARNAAAAVARGDWLAFVRERDLLLEPHALATLVEAAARLDAEAISGFVYKFQRPGAPNPNWDGEIGLAPIGPCVPMAAFENRLGDDLFLISRRAFHALGGFEAGVSTAIEDRLLLTRAAAQGVKLDLAPAPLAWRRADAVGQGDDVADLRRVLAAFAQTPLGVFATALESLLTQTPPEVRAAARLAAIEIPARDFAVKLTSELASGGPATFQTFVRYLLARSRFVEALDFARSHDSETLTPLVEAALARDAERHVRRSPRANAEATPIWLSLTPELTARLRLQTAPEGATMGRDAHCIASILLLRGVTVAKAPLACPPGVQRLTGAFDFAAEGTLEADVALLVAEPLAQAVMTDDGPAPGAGLWWSGWRPAERGPVRIELDGLPASTGPRDVFFVGRNKTHDVVWAVWREARAQGSLSDLVTPSALHLAESRAKVPLHVLEQGELLTDASDFPYAVWIPGQKTLHHPLAGRPAVVRVPRAVPAGATGVAASFSIDNDHSHPVAFALWLRPASAAGDPALAEAPADAEWTLCKTPFQVETGEVRLEKPASEWQDLYLATKVVGFDDVGWCHAQWRELLVIEPVLAM